MMISSHVPIEKMTNDVGIRFEKESYGEESNSPTVPVLPRPFLREPLEGTIPVVPCITFGSARLDRHLCGKFMRIYVFGVQLRSDHGWFDEQDGSVGWFVFCEFCSRTHSAIRISLQGLGKDSITWAHSVPAPAECPIATVRLACNL